MVVSDAQKRASKKWLTEKVENITFRVPKGKKEQIKAAADRSGESVNAFLNRIVDTALEQDSE